VLEILHTLKWEKWAKTALVSFKTLNTMQIRTPAFFLPAFIAIHISLPTDLAKNQQTSGLWQ
jgi:hypothetical protein